MLQKAIEKLQKEMKENKNKPYIQVVGEFLLRYIKDNSDAAEKILNKNKTIEESLGEMKKVAKSKAVNGYAVLTDQESFEIVLKYFEISSKININQGTEKTQHVKTIVEQPVQEDTNTSFNVSLEDFL